MSQSAEQDLDELLASLPPSAWMLEGIDTPRNSWCVFAKKGGTSKTSMTLTLADALARFGLNVLVTDFDHQGNLSLGLDCSVNLVLTGTTKLGKKPEYEPDRFTIVEIIAADEDGVLDEGFSLVRLYLG